MRQFFRIPGAAVFLLAPLLLAGCAHADMPPGVGGGSGLRHIDTIVTGTIVATIFCLFAVSVWLIRR